MSKNLASKTASGVKWSTASTVFNAVLQLGYGAIMARLLEPEEFGLVAMMHVILRFVDYFAKMGMGHAIIQKKTLSAQEIRAGFTSSFLLGFVSMVFVYFAAPYVTLFFENERLVEVIRFSSVLFLIQGLSTTAVGLLTRDLEFKVLAILNVISYVVGYLFVGIYMAYSGYGVYSLISALMVQVFVNGVLSYLYVKHSLIFIFKLKFYKELLSYGSKISVISFLDFINLSLDKILIEKFLGTAQLGYYDRASQIVYLPMYFLANSFSKVMLPSFSKLQDDIAKLGKVYKEIVVGLSAVLFPLCIYIGLFAQDIVLLLLGEGWEKSIPILRIIAVAVSLRMITMFAGIICDATANLRVRMINNIAQMVSLCISFYFLSYLGLEGFAYAIVISQVVNLIAFVFTMNKVLNISILKLFSLYLPALKLAFFSIISLVIVKYLFALLNAPFIIEFVFASGISILIIFFLICLFPPKELINYIVKFIDKKEIVLYNLSMKKYQLQYSTFLKKKL